MQTVLTITCPNCNGGGEVTVAHCSGNPELERPTRCPECDGTGETDVEASEVEELIEAVVFARRTAAGPMGYTNGADLRLERALIGLGRAA